MLSNGRLDLGGYDYYLGTTWRSHLLELRFDTNQGCFLGQPAGSETTLTIAPQGLTKTDLMGELGHLLALPAYQLALPFTHEAWRQLEYTGILTGTTHILIGSRGLASCRESARLAGATGEPVHDFLACARKSR